jgi:hypothetical protein
MQIRVFRRIFTLIFGCFIALILTIPNAVPASAHTSRFIPKSKTVTMRTHYSLAQCRKHLKVSDPTLTGCYLEVQLATSTFQPQAQQPEIVCCSSGCPAAGNQSATSTAQWYDQYWNGNVLGWRTTLYTTWSFDGNCGRPSLVSINCTRNNYSGDGWSGISNTSCSNWAVDAFTMEAEDDVSVTHNLTHPYTCTGWATTQVDNGAAFINHNGSNC